MHAMHRSQGFLDDDNSAGTRIGPVVPKSSTHSSTAKTIQKPPQLSSLPTKLFATIATHPQRTLVATSLIPRANIQPVTILPQQQATLHLPPPMDEPASKRLKTEDQLMPEEDFYKAYGKVRMIEMII